MKFDTPCPICGKPVHLEMPPDVQDPSMIVLLRDKLSKMVCHTECSDKRYHETQQRDEVSRLAKRLEHWTSMCPAAYQDTDGSRLPSQFAKVMEWQWSNKKGLLLHGRTGLGKTRCLLKLLEREFKSFRVVIFMTHSEFSQKCLQSMDNARQHSSWLEIIERVDILAIDDLGNAKFTDSHGQGRQTEQSLFGVFEKRLTCERPTMFTTNFNSRSLIDSMSPERGEPFVRRLKEFSQSISFNQ